jgi:hypothetical protein
MLHKRILIFVLGGHLLILALIYLPFAFKHLQQLEIIVPGFFNLVFIGISFAASLIASLVPEWRKYCGYWWLSFGAVLLASVPVCLGTVQLNTMIVR